MRLKDSIIAVVVATAALFSPGGGLAAQSLADVARQEEERRKTIKESAKVLTNKDLAVVPVIEPPAPTPPAAADGATPAEPAKSAGAAEASGAAKPVASPPKDQDYWASRAKTLRAELARNETFAVALQSRINALTNEYTNKSDPIQQAAVANDRQKATDELNRLTKQIADDKKAIETLQEDARRAGVPPGWLR